jgi:hypothetical protein
MPKEIGHPNEILVFPVQRRVNRFGIEKGAIDKSSDYGKAD